jgi:hypothetical protein
MNPPAPKPPATTALASEAKRLFKGQGVAIGIVVGFIMALVADFVAR